ncbi:MAG TPA: hypothetical protein VFV67_13225 [Actinophytocola sp.]|uniref:hypothetical protein n=1 Tax=Actinophytocola sp. TaxID=1872138 RepID=UPI002DB746E5|nr:hypothetical protein [Actinophytocola sp.]HEU5471609.1 hypothetical protein [Actinophytocola sp.]
MPDSELHMQASLWNGKHGRTAVLVMEGAARDRSDGGGVAVDALHRIALARGLRLTTDLDRRDTRPVGGWRVRIDRIHAVTVEWPHHRPLVDGVPLDLPSGWLRTASGAGELLLLVGYGLGLRTGTGRLSAQLERACRDGALVAGTVPLLTTDPDPAELPTQRVPGDDRVFAGAGDRIAVG